MRFVVCCWKAVLQLFRNESSKYSSQFGPTQECESNSSITRITHCSYGRIHCHSVQNYHVSRCSIDAGTAASAAEAHATRLRRGEAACMRSRDSLLDHPKLHICHHVSSHLPSSDEHFIHLERSDEAFHAHSQQQPPKCTNPPWTSQRSSSTLRTTRLPLSRWPSSRTSTLWMRSKRSTLTTLAVLLLRARGSTFAKSVLRARQFTISSLSCTSPQTVSNG
jgi:hypothetical protein